MTIKGSKIIFIAVLWEMALPSLAGAGIMEYLASYQLGIDYASSQNSLVLSYRVDASNAGLDSKQCKTGNGIQMTCHADIVHRNSDGFGLVLEKAFKRKDFWHFDWGSDGSVRWLSGKLNESERRKQQKAGLPLKEMSYGLATFVLKPRVRFGITPASKWPDVLLSLGPALQASLGEVRINGEKKMVGLGTSSGVSPLSAFIGFIKLEIVVWRFGDGALSFFSESDWSGNGRSTKFYPGTVDGMDNFLAKFESSTNGAFFGFGLKLLSNWP